MQFEKRVFNNLLSKFDSIEKKIIRKNASKKETIIKERENTIIDIYDKIIEQVNLCIKSNSIYIKEIEDSYDLRRTKLKNCLRILRSRFTVPEQKYKTIKAKQNTEPVQEIVIVEKQMSGPSGSNANIIEENKQIDKDIEIINKMDAPKVIENLNRIIKDSFDGEPTQLDSFVNAVQLSKLIIKENEPEIFIQFVKSRLKNKALEVARDAQTIDEILDALKTGIKPEKARVLENRLLSLRLNNKNKMEFSKEVESMTEMYRLALISEKIPHEVAKEMIIQKTRDMCMANTKSDRIKSVLSSKTFNTIPEVVSELLIQLDTVQIEHQISALRVSNNNNYRGNNNNRFKNNRFQRFNNNRYNARGNNYNRYNNNRGRNYNYNRNNNNYRGNYNNSRGNYNNRNNRNRSNNYNNNNNNRNSQGVRFLEEENTSQRDNHPQVQENRMNQRN